MAIEVPDASVPISVGDGRPSQAWYAILSRLVGVFNRVNVDVNNPGSGLLSRAAKTQSDFQAVYIEFADDKEYPFVDWAWDFEIEEVSTVAQSGTCTVTIEINGTPLGGSANSASTTPDTEVHSSDNVVEDGDTVAIVVSSNSSCEGLSVTLRGTRTLA